MRWQQMVRRNVRDGVCEKCWPGALIRVIVESHSKGDVGSKTSCFSNTAGACVLRAFAQPGMLFLQISEASLHRLLSVSMVRPSLITFLLF